MQAKPMQWAVKTYSAWKPGYWAKPFGESFVQ